MNDRKQAHIELANKASTSSDLLDRRFSYEPLFGHHNLDAIDISINFNGFHLGAPIWVSSMTGGTELAGELNRLLAEVTAEFQLGMGLGSCRPLIESDQYFSDFNLRPILGDDRPFFMNLGVAQVEEFIQSNKLSRIGEMNEKLQTDGLFVHINPLQEWYQPEGDRYSRPALETIQELLEELPIKIAVKEVGQGMGPRSLDALMRMNLFAIEFGAFGGTNFSKLETLRSNEGKDEGFAFVGHTAKDMVNDINLLCKKHRDEYNCLNFIVSGGIKSYLDGHYLLEELESQGIIGHASAFLRSASNGIDSLRKFTLSQVEGYKMAQQFLNLRSVKMKDGN